MNGNVTLVAPHQTLSYSTFCSRVACWTHDENEPEFMHSLPYTLEKDFRLKRGGRIRLHG